MRGQCTSPATSRLFTVSPILVHTWAGDSVQYGVRRISQSRTTTHSTLVISCCLFKLLRRIYLNNNQFSMFMILRTICSMAMARPMYSPFLQVAQVFTLDLQVLYIKWPFLQRKIWVS